MVVIQYREKWACDKYSAYIQLLWYNTLYNHCDTIQHTVKEHTDCHTIYSIMTDTKRHTVRVHWLSYNTQNKDDGDDNHNNNSNYHTVQWLWFSDSHAIRSTVTVK